MVENLTNMAVFEDKLGSVATGFKSRLDQAKQNFGKSSPTEETPVMYKITHKGGALVQEGNDPNSSRVDKLAAGETVTVVELVGLRARIITPVEGWVSTETKDRVQIMRPCALQRRSAQNEAFETMFEQKFHKMKVAQSSQGSGVDPRSAEFDSRKLDGYSPPGSPRSSPRGSDGEGSRGSRERADRDRGDRRGGVESSGGGTPVPRLAAPGSKGGPSPTSATSGSPAGGSDFDLLSMGDPGTQSSWASGSPQPSFGPFPGTPAAAAAPVQSPARPGASGWASFQDGAGRGPQSGVGGVEADFDPNAPPSAVGTAGNNQVMGMQTQMGGPMFPSQAVGWGISQAAPQMAPQAPGWYGGQGQPQAAHVMGLGAAPQMGGCGMQQPQQANQTGSAQMGMQQQTQEVQNWGGFTSAPQVYFGDAPTLATPMQGMAMPGVAAPGTALADSLMSQAMGGISNLGAQQRRAGQTGPMGMQTQMPMGAMGPQVR